MNFTEIHPACDFNKMFYAKKDPNRCDAAGQTLLHEMCRDGNLNAVETLGCLGGDRLDFRAADYEGIQPIHEAARCGHEDIVLYLNAIRGVSVESATHDGKTPLFIAVENSRLAVLRRLLELGARTDVRESRNGRTPLHVAAAGGDMLAAGTLIAAGADVTLRDAAGATAYDAAYKAGFEDTAKLIGKFMVIRRFQRRTNAFAT